MLLHSHKLKPEISFSLRLKISYQKEIATRIREAEQEVKERSDKVAKDILVQAMQRIAGDYVAEQTNSTVHLPDDTMKGRIIGREGRNIPNL